jgi:hypothetical protein
LVNQNNSPSATPYQGVGSIIQNALNSAKDTGVSYLSPIKNRDSGEEEYGDFGNRFSGTYRNARRGGFGGAMLVL